MRWKASSVTLVGHSGGAAVAANVAALDPDLIQHVYLVACPCDVPAFRRHMARAQLDPMWLLPSTSLSPMMTLEAMDRRTTIVAISGNEDVVALPDYARRYVARARQRGLDARTIVLLHFGHVILNEPPVLSAVADSQLTPSPAANAGAH